VREALLVLVVCGKEAMSGFVWERRNDFATERRPQLERDIYIYIYTYIDISQPHREVVPHNFTMQTMKDFDYF